MKLDDLEKLADAATLESNNICEIELGDISSYEMFIAAANPQTIKKLIALCRLQHEALIAVRENYITDEEQTLIAIAAYDKINGGK